MRTPTASSLPNNADRVNSEVGVVERSYCVTRYCGAVVHLRDPRMIDRTRCKLHVARWVPESILGRLTLCYSCQQDEAREMAERTAGGGEG